MPAIRVQPGSRVNLKDIDPRECGKWDKSSGEMRAEELGTRLSELQELLFAANRTPLLIVLQGRDTAGKDGMIRFLLRYLNAQSTSVTPFKVPSVKEMAHDYLWRVHQAAPGKGETMIFNRSHYEDVLVVRVHDLVPRDVWSKRYDHINDFERLLTDTGTKVLKFFLHISKEEQEERLLEREKDPTKTWKLAVGDWKERELWDQYTEAYEDALTKCSTDNAPWHIIPADRKWHRNLAITEAIVEALEPTAKQCMEALDEIGRVAKLELEAYRNPPPA